MMKLLYTRVSTIDQKTDRQRVNEKDYQKIVEDKCSGAIAFFDRPGGKQVKQYLDDGKLSSLSVWQIDRLGRDLRDIINTIHYFTERNVPIVFEAQGLRTLDESGKENPISKLMISILGIVGEMERNMIRERQREGIERAKDYGKFTGRKKGTTEDVLQFLGKAKNKKALDYLKKGYKPNEVAKLCELHPNTITKIRQVAFPKP